MGSVYQCKDGRWEARQSLGKNENGKRQSKSFYGKTEEEAKEKMQTANIYNGTLAVTGMSVSDLCSEWLKIVSNRVKVSTLANYRMKLNKHITPYFGAFMCNDVTSKLVYIFIDEKLKSGLSARYVTDILVLLKSVFKYAFREYNIRNPLEGVVMPKCEKPDVKLLNPDQQNTLKKYIDKNLTLTTLGIALALTLGLRLGEVCGLQWQDIDLEKRILNVRRTVQRVATPNGDNKTELMVLKPKSESSIREIPIPDTIVAMLKKFENKPEIYILSGKETPLEPRTMQYRFAIILKNVDLPSVTFHSLRHAFATSAVELGFDIKTLSELLGHSKVEVTLNRYVHSSIDRKRTCMELMKWSA